MNVWVTDACFIEFLNACLWVWGVVCACMSLEAGSTANENGMNLHLSPVRLTADEQRNGVETLKEKLD